MLLPEDDELLLRRRDGVGVVRVPGGSQLRLLGGDRGGDGLRPLHLGGSFLLGGLDLAEVVRHLVRSRLDAPIALHRPGETRRVRLAGVRPGIVEVPLRVLRSLPAGGIVETRLDLDKDGHYRSTSALA
ncbi:hypothetical protein [Mycolicibacterium grossiae]|uniref:hypothetical protein n=1 Tax=Mycolicibacterium grossiae TaxID=1552759 RepID=UPI00159F6F77|nr:hypothetical protein [Mycolicibacterium grossiae]